MKYFLFLGVSTKASTINQIFPLWANILGRSDLDLACVDLPLDGGSSQYLPFIDQLMHRDTLGALVTSHKAALFKVLNESDLSMSPRSRQLREVSCFYRVNSTINCDALDSDASFPILDRLTSYSQWLNGQRHVLIIGAGGAGLSMLYALSRTRNSPRSVTIAEVKADRSALADTISDELGLRDYFAVNVVLNENLPSLISDMPRGSLIINASGIGKDRSGNLTSEEFSLPEESLIWEFNYRGELDLLKRANADASFLNLVVEDGWEYFIRGWLNHMCRACGVIDPERHFQQFRSVANKYAPNPGTA